MQPQTNGYMQNCLQKKTEGIRLIWECTNTMFLSITLEDTRKRYTRENWENAE